MSYNFNETSQHTIDKFFDGANVCANIIPIGACQSDIGGNVNFSFSLKHMNGVKLLLVLCMKKIGGKLIINFKPTEENHLDCQTLSKFNSSIDRTKTLLIKHPHNKKYLINLSNKTGDISITDKTMLKNIKENGYMLILMMDNTKIKTLDLFGTKSLNDPFKCPVLTCPTDSSPKVNCPVLKCPEAKCPKCPKCPALKCKTCNEGFYSLLSMSSCMVIIILVILLFTKKALNTVQ